MKLRVTNVPMAIEEISTECATNPPVGFHSSEISKALFSSTDKFIWKKSGPKDGKSGYLISSGPILSKKYLKVRKSPATMKFVERKVI